MAMKSAMLAVGLALGVASFAVAAQEPVINQSEVRLVGCVENEEAFRTKIREQRKVSARATWC